MFLVCGEALFDLFSGAADAEVPVFRGVPGGSPFNVAVGLARLGRPVALATQIFDDMLGRRLEQALEKEGVNLSLVRRSGGATPLALVEIDREGLPHYTFQGLREMRVCPDPADDLLSSFKGIHVGSVPIVSDCSAERLLDLVRGAGGRLVSFDPNVRLAVEPDAARWQTQVDRFRQYANVVKLSFEDLEAIYGHGCDPHQIGASWVDDGAGLVMITRGNQGCVILAADHKPVEIPAVPTDVADTVGAGDAFMAALLCWLDEAGYAEPNALRALSREQLGSMGEFAVRAAARACARPGPDMPRRSELARTDQ